MKVSLLLVFLFLSSWLSAQQLSVKSFRKLENDLSARGSEGRTDQNGDKCAVIKIVTTETGFVFEPDALGMAGSVQKTGEVWLYVPYGAKRLTVKHPQLGVLRNYVYPERIDQACVYEMVLVTGRIVTTVEEQLTEQWLVITVEPKDALVYIDDNYESAQDGVVSKYLKYGLHTYRVESAPFYHTEAGSVEVKGDKRVEVKVTLKPAFGYLSVSSTPSGSRIWVDNTEVGVTPYKSDRLAEGAHKLRIQRDLYHTVEKELELLAGKTHTENITLVPAFGYLSVSSTPESGADVFIDGVKVGVTPFKSDRLKSGEHRLRVVKAMYQPQEETVVVSDSQTVKKEVNLAANFATVTFRTSADAELWVNNENKGKGQWSGRLSSGLCLVEARQASHRTVRQSVELLAGEKRTIDISAPEPIYGHLNLSSSPLGARIVIDGKDYGTTPQLIRDLLTGSHRLVLSKAGCATVEQAINIEEGKTASLTVSLPSGRSITIRTNPSDGEIWVDGKFVGKSLQTLELGYGKHKVKGVWEKQKKVKEYIVMEKGGDTEWILNRYFQCGDSLFDIRDGQKYQTRLLADGRCWMVENLRFGNCGGADFTYSETNIQNRLAPGYWGVCIASPVTGGGNLYNWQAAMNSESAEYNTSGNPSGNIDGSSPKQWRGICPKGWHLPSGGVNGEFQKLYKACKQGSQIYPGTEHFKGVLGGYGSGSFVNEAGSKGYYWSSTYGSIKTAYSLYFFSNNVGPQFNYYKSHGFAVRCIKDYLEEKEEVFVRKEKEFVVNEKEKEILSKDFRCGGLLVDRRDGQKYRTRLLADGHCWMVENLRFGKCSGTDFAAYFKSSVQNRLAPGYWGVCIASTKGGGGNLYNWQAAINRKSAEYNTSGNPSGNIDRRSPKQWRGICPKGWHLPSGGSSGEFQKLYEAYGNQKSKIYPGVGDFEGVFGGYGDGSSVYHAGSYAYYWSSTYNSTTNAYYLYFDSGYINPQYSNSKYSGFAVRCVKDY